MVIILNDNNMSISENVGGMAQVLQNMRIKPAYISFKQWLKGVSENIPGLYKSFPRYQGMAEIPAPARKRVQ